jgi:N-acylneuraminate cytidylyltransferase/CMP-N,N'-diacetyllegionaminic acid synthase
MLGKPLISWTIDAALAAPSIDSIVVSTDDEEIANVSRSAGARVPFMRPISLASDTASSIDVLFHVIDTLEQMGEHYDLVVLLEPTSPLRNPSDIEQALSQLIENRAGSVVSVCRAESHHPAFMYRQTDDSRLMPFTNQQPTALRRQDIEPVYFLEGTVYCSHIDILRAQQSFYHQDTLAYEVPKWKSIEIDDIYDFVMVEALMRFNSSFV